MPDTFTLVFRDPNRDILGKAGLEIGKKVEISTDARGVDTPGDPDHGRGHLHRGRVRHAGHAGRRPRLRPARIGWRPAARPPPSRTSTYSDIAQQIAGDAGLTAEVDDSAGRYEHVFQVEPVGPRLPVRPRPRDRLRLPRGRRRRCCSRSRSSPPAARARATSSSSRPAPARLGREPARVPGAHERGRPGRGGRGPRLGPGRQGGGASARPTRPRTNAELTTTPAALAEQGRRTRRWSS